MNIILEDLIEKDLINCYTEMEKINKLVNNAYISHDELLLIKEELRLANLLKIIKNIAHLRQDLVN